MNWTSSFLVQSDQVVIVLHLLLAPVCTVVKQQNASLLVVQVRVRRRCHDVLSRIVGRRYTRSVEEQGVDT